MRPVRYEVRYLGSVDKPYPGRFARLAVRGHDDKKSRKHCESVLAKYGKDIGQEYFFYHPEDMGYAPAWGILETTEPEINEWGEVAP